MNEEGKVTKSVCGTVIRSQESICPNNKMFGPTR